MLEICNLKRDDKLILFIILTRRKTILRQILEDLLLHRPPVSSRYIHGRIQSLRDQGFLRCVSTQPNIYAINKLGNNESEIFNALHTYIKVYFETEKCLKNLLEKQ